MLLSLMRKHAKSYLIKFLIAIIAVVFIFYFGYSFTSKEGMKVATVNGELITGVEYQKVYRNMLERLQKEYKSFWNENLIKVFDLKNRALDAIIKEKLVSQEARRIGLEVTDKEVQDQILAYPAFQFRGRFDESRYRMLLANNRMKPEDFEAGMARGLLQQKIEQFLMSFVPVTDQEIQDFYTYTKERVRISFVRFSSTDFESSVKVDDSAMAAYFEEHKEDYRIPDKIKISYILVDPDRFKDEVSVSNQQVTDYYEENIEIYKEKKKVKARHILFKLEQNASEEDEKKVKARAQEVLEKARKGEDFATLAKTYSEGPTKEKGGDLGTFTQGQMVKPFEEAAFKMKEGEVSDLVKTSFGYHIIKVEDVKEAYTKEFEEVRGQIAETLSKITRADLAHEKALSLIDQMPYEVDLAEYAKEQDVLNKETDFFAQNEPVPDFGGDERLRKTLFSLEKGDISELIEFGEKFYIIQVSDRKASYLPEMVHVFDEVKDKYTAHLTQAEAKSAAEKYLAALRDGADWTELSKTHGRALETTEFFTRSDPIKKIGYAPELQEAAFTLSEDKRYPDGAFENQDGAYVIRWEGYEGIDSEQFNQEKEKYRTSLFRARHGSLVQDWVENLKSKAEIDILTPVDS